jgi:hypothetical protein
MEVTAAERRAFLAGINMGAVIASAGLDVREFVALCEEKPEYFRMLRTMGMGIVELSPDLLKVGAETMRKAYEEGRSESKSADR